MKTCMMHLAFEIFHLLGALGSSSKVIILHYCANQPSVLIQILHQEKYISLRTFIKRIYGHIQSIPYLSSLPWIRIIKSLIPLNKTKWTSTETTHIHGWFTTNVKNSYGPYMQSNFLKILNASRTTIRI